MAEIVRRVPVKYVKHVVEASLTCPECGCGAGVGSPAAAGWEEGEACPTGICKARGRIGVVVLQPETSYTVRIPGYVVVRCECGAEVPCTDSFANPCNRCQREYMSGGQLLAPREQWGEETGESIADILGPGDPFDG